MGIVDYVQDKKNSYGYFFCSFSPLEILEKCDFLEVSDLATNNRRYESDNKKTIRFKNFDLFCKDVLKSDFVISHDISCVYMIDDLYIGATGSLYKRLKQHFTQAVNNKHCNRWFNKKLIEYLISKKRIEIKILSFNLDDENYYIKKNGGYDSNLCNSKNNIS